MADPPTLPEPDARPDPGPPPRMPRWVKWPAIVLGVLIALLLVLRFFGIEHGPGLHTPGGDQPPAGVTPGSHAPGGGHG